MKQVWNCQRLKYKVTCCELHNVIYTILPGLGPNYRHVLFLVLKIDTKRWSRCGTVKGWSTKWPVVSYTMLSTPSYLALAQIALLLLVDYRRVLFLVLKIDTKRWSRCGTVKGWSTKRVVSTPSYLHEDSTLNNVTWAPCVTVLPAVCWMPGCLCRCCAPSVPKNRHEKVKQVWNCQRLKYKASCFCMKTVLWSMLPGLFLTAPPARLW